MFLLKCLLLSVAPDAEMETKKPKLDSDAAAAKEQCAA